jgi:DNA-binding CsgD family transcriptional regulator
MEAAAAKALRRGAPHIAAAAFERAARLTADPAKRGALLLRVAEMELELGHPDLSVRLLAEANPLALREQERTRLSLLAQMLDDDSWSGELRIASFLEITDQMMVNGDHELAMETLLTIALRCWWGNPDQGTRDAVVGAAEQIQCDMNTPSLLAVLGLADPVGRGALVADRISRMTPDLTDPVGMLMVGRACTAVWAFDLSLPFLDAAVHGLRTQDRLGLLAQALVTQAWAAAHCAREPLAVAAAEEGHRLSKETGQARWMAAAQLAKAMVAAERGDSSAAEALATEAEALLMSMGASSMLALAQFVRGRGAVAHQRYSDGLDHHERILDPTDPAYHPFIGAWALSDLVEAAAHSGKLKLAKDHLEQLESLAAATSGSLLRAEAGYARPMVADDDHAEALFQGALERDLVGWPCHRGRMLLWYGRWLRRRRRVADSRAPLRAAREGFDALALPVFAERARQELRASGEATEHPVPQPWAPWGGKPGPPGPLTPQELQIARMAADGLSNREIGERLYLSHRTVGSHLYRMFPKLGVTSRSQLRSALELVIADAP